LYDSILEELEDDVIAPQEVEDLAVKVVDVEEVDQDVDLLVDEAPAGPEQEAEAGLLSESSNDTEETFI